MFFAYADESGDSGRNGSPSDYFCLGVLLVHDRSWLSLLDDLIAFRRQLKDKHGLRLHDEVKAAHLLHNKGDVREHWISHTDRLEIYDSWLQRLEDFARVKAFAVCINKNALQRQDVDPRAWAWQYVIQRLERFGRAEGENIHILPDEGHGQFIRKKIRQMRRFSKVRSAFGTETLSREADNIVEDSSDRKSEESYFIQSADLIAYAAARRIHPTPVFGGQHWDCLATVRLTEVNRLRGGEPGIVSWP